MKAGAGINENDRNLVKTKGLLSGKTIKIDKLVMRMMDLEEKGRSGIQFSDRTSA